MRNKKIFVGVTGGIGSGKSLVCKYLEELGCRVLYADDLAKKLYDTNAKLRGKLVKEFGKDIFVKGKISNDLFSDKRKVQRVNSIVHPFVIFEKLKMYKKIKKGIVITEAALIFESGFDKFLDYSVVVYSNQETRIGRVRKRSKLSVKKIKEIMKLQMPEKIKMERADFILKNDSTTNELRQKTIFLYKLLKEILKKK